MVDDWWQSAPGKIAAPPISIWESGGGGKFGYLSGIFYSILGYFNIYYFCFRWKVCLAKLKTKNFIQILYFLGDLI